MNNKVKGARPETLFTLFKPNILNAGQSVNWNPVWHILYQFDIIHYCHSLTKFLIFNYH